MRRTVEAIFERLRPDSLKPELEALAKVEAELATIEENLSEARGDVPLLDKLNPFKTTDAEREVRRLKSERSKTRKERDGIRDRLKADIRTAIADEPTAQIAIRVGELDESVESAERRLERLGVEGPRSTAQGAAVDASQFRVAGLDDMRRCVTSCRSALDDLKRVLREKADIETEGLTEASLIEATMDRLRHAADLST